MSRLGSVAIACLAVSQALTACAGRGVESVSSDYEYREDDRAVQETEFRRQCEARGGYVYTEGTSRSRIASAKHRSSRMECAVRRRGSIVSNPG